MNLSPTESQVTYHLHSDDVVDFHTMRIPEPHRALVIQSLLPKIMCNDLEHMVALYLMPPGQMNWLFLRCYYPRSINFVTESIDSTQPYTWLEITLHRPPVLQPLSPSAVSLSNVER